MKKKIYKAIVVAVILSGVGFFNANEAFAVWTGSANWAGSAFGWNAMAPSPVKSYNITSPNDAIGYRYVNLVLNYCNNSQARLLSDVTPKVTKTGPGGAGCGLNYTVSDYDLGVLGVGAHSLSCEAGSVEGVVTSLTLTSGGTGYTGVPTVTISGGGGAGATATATIGGGVVTSLVVTNVGSGYTSNPTVTITGGGATIAATATATIGVGVVTSLTLTSGGTGYTGVPTVTISGGGGAGATATATIGGGVVTSLTLTSGGTGYTSNPTVTITGGGATTNATATATAIPDASSADCTVTIPPPTCTLTPSPAEVVSGDALTLNYTTKYAFDADLTDDAVGSWTNLTLGTSSKVLNPTAKVPAVGNYMTYIYTMTVTGPGGTSTCSTTVQLKPKCTLKCNESLFGPATNPCVVAMGQDVDLAWTTTDWEPTKPLTITNTAGDFWDVSAITSPAVGIDTFIIPPVTYTMNVTAVNNRTNTCTVMTGKLPSCTITASPINLIAGQSSTLTWSSTDATSATLVPGPGGGLSGSKVVTPAATTTYKLNVSNGLGTNFCETVVNVTPGILPSCTLTASPASIISGMAVILTWTSTNAASAVIDNGAGLASPVAGGNKFAYPTSDTTYTMTVTSTTGHTNTCSAGVVTVTPSSSPIVTESPLQLEEFTGSARVIFHDVAKTLLSFVGAIALLICIISGIYFMISRGVPENRTKAKKMLLYAIIGMSITIISYALLTVIEKLTVN